MALSSGKILAEQIQNTDTFDQTKKCKHKCLRVIEHKSDNSPIISKKGVTDSTEVLINQECATIRIEFESYLNMRPFLLGQLTKERDRDREDRYKWNGRFAITVHIYRGEGVVWGGQFINCSLRMLMTD